MNGLQDGLSEYQQRESNGVDFHAEFDTLRAEVRFTIGDALTGDAFSMSEAELRWFVGQAESYLRRTESVRSEYKAPEIPF